MVRRTLLKNTSESFPETNDPAPEAAKSEEAAGQPAPDPNPSSDPDPSAADPNPEGNTIPPFESVDPMAFAADPLAAAAATEKNTSAFFAELENYRLDETETQGLGVGKEILTSVPVRRPGRKEFFRCHPDPRMTLALALFVDDGEDGDGETYLVAKDMRETFGDDVAPTLLQLSMLRNGTIILMPLKIPTADSGRGRRWRESLMLAADIAKTKWIKIQSDRSISGYRVFPALGQISEPKWPDDKTFEEYLEIAFRDRIIKSKDHPVARKYQGQ